jgi:DNA-binding PadR family transcriptional regulator
MKQVGELRMWILHVIDENGPSNGVEIRDNVQKHYDWQVQWHKDNHMHPHTEESMQSKKLLPGSLYPMLKKMVSEGLINKLDDGKYSLTENGQIIVTNIFEHFQTPDEQGDHKTISIENSLEEINMQLSYIESTDKEEIAPFKESLELLIERLKKINESLK